MKKYQAFWLISSIIILLIISYNLRIGYYGDNSAGSVFSAVVFSSITWAFFWFVRNKSWIKGKLVNSPNYKEHFLPNALQRSIALFVAICILLVQANRVGHNGFDGIAWIFGLGLSSILILFSVHGLTFIHSTNEPS